MAPHKTELPFDAMINLREKLKKSYDFPDNFADGVTMATNDASQMVLERMDERFDSVDARFARADKREKKRFKKVAKRLDAMADTIRTDSKVLLRTNIIGIATLVIGCVATITFAVIELLV